MTTLNMVPATFVQEDHETWSKLYARQLPMIEGVTCADFRVGFPKLGLDPLRLPNQAEMSARLQALTGWTLVNAQNGYLGATEWFEHLAERRFPVTDYIRRPHELDFTPNPDLFHEYFGHLAFFTDQYFADSAEMFGHLYLSAQSERQQLEIARLWWFTTEFGLIRENGELKILGAGLYSSPGELQNALKPETPRLPFDIRRVAETPGAAYAMHTHYFVLDDKYHTRQIVEAYARMEGLNVPQSPTRTA